MRLILIIKMNTNKTLWMGNIESWMDEEYLDKLLSDLRNLKNLII